MTITREQIEKLVDVVMDEIEQSRMISKSRLVDALVGKVAVWATSPTPTTTGQVNPMPTGRWVQVPSPAATGGHVWHFDVNNTTGTTTSTTTVWTAGSISNGQPYNDPIAAAKNWISQEPSRLFKQLTPAGQWTALVAGVRAWSKAHGEPIADGMRYTWKDTTGKAHEVDFVDFAGSTASSFARFHILELETEIVHEQRKKAAQPFTAAELIRASDERRAVLEKRIAESIQCRAQNVEALKKIGIDPEGK